MMKNKKALSEVVSYVLLIVVAISLSIIVFAFLRNFVPQERIGCNEGLSLVIRDFECYPSTGEVKIEFQNKGNFKIDGIYIRSANSTTNATINLLNATTHNGIYDINSITEQRTGFLYFGRSDFPLALAPNRNYAQTFDYGEYGKLTKIQIQPFLNDKETNELIICEDKTITQEIICN